MNVQITSKVIIQLFMNVAIFLQYKTKNVTFSYDLHPIFCCFPLLLSNIYLFILVGDSSSSKLLALNVPLPTGIKHKLYIYNPSTISPKYVAFLSVASGWPL